MGKKWTKDEVEFLRKFYPQYGKKYCAQELGRTEESVKGKVQYENITGPGRGVTRLDLWSNVDEVIDKYHEVGSLHGTAQFFETTGRTIRSILDEHDVPVKSIGEARRVYSADWNFFREITPESAFVLGFWFADGSFNGDKNNGISFCQYSRAIIAHIRDLMSSDHPIKSYSTSKSGYKTEQPRSYSLTLYHRGIEETIRSYCPFDGNDKSHTAKYPTIENYHRDFIRGYFEGDGSIGLHSRPGIEQLALTMRGTKQLLCSVQQYLMSICDLSKTKICRGGAPQLYYGGNQQVPRIMNWLYPEERRSELFLDGKWSTYQDCLEQIYSC